MLDFCSDQWFRTLQTIRFCRNWSERCEKVAIYGRNTLKNHRTYNNTSDRNGFGFFSWHATVFYWKKETVTQKSQRHSRGLCNVYAPLIFRVFYWNPLAVIEFYEFWTLEDFWSQISIDRIIIGYKNNENAKYLRIYKNPSKPKMSKNSRNAWNRRNWRNPRNSTSPKNRRYWRKTRNWGNPRNQRNSRNKRISTNSRYSRSSRNRQI